MDWIYAQHMGYEGDVNLDKLQANPAGPTNTKHFMR